MNSVVWGSWQRWLPTVLMPAVRGVEELAELQTEGDPAFRLSEVQRRKKYFDSPVITPIDKCSQHLPMW